MNINNLKSTDLYRLTSLAPPSYALPLNFIFLQYYVWDCAVDFGFQKSIFYRANQRTEGVAENDDVDVDSCVILSCSSVMAEETDASEAIRSVVATLPNIKKLKPEQEQSLLSFVFMAILPRGSGKDICHDQTLAIGYGR
jgi:hypothetical protein